MTPEVLRRAVDLARRSPSPTLRCCSPARREPARRSSRKPSTTPAAGRRGLSWRSTARLSRANCSKANCSATGPAVTGAAKDKKGLFRGGRQRHAIPRRDRGDARRIAGQTAPRARKRRFIKIGETRPTRVDVRLIATNRDLEKEIAAGNFREDLYFRLSVFRIHLPRCASGPATSPDISASSRRSSPTKWDVASTRSTPTTSPLSNATRHGNVRELRNAVERSMIMADGNRLTADCLAPDSRGGRPADPDSLALDDPNTATFSGCWNTPGATRPKPPACWASASPRYTANSTATG